MTTKPMTTQQEEQLQALIDRAEIAYERAQVPDGQLEYDLEEVEAAEESIFAYVNDLLGEKASQIAQLEARIAQLTGALQQIRRARTLTAVDGIAEKALKGEIEAEADDSNEDDKEGYVDPDDISPELHDFLTDQGINPATLTYERLEIAERLMHREQRRRQRASEREE